MVSVSNLSAERSHSLVVANELIDVFLRHREHLTRLDVDPDLKDGNQVSERAV